MQNQQRHSEIDPNERSGEKRRSEKEREKEREKHGEKKRVDVPPMVCFELPASWRSFIVIDLCVCVWRCLELNGFRRRNIIYGDRDAIVPVVAARSGRSLQNGACDGDNQEADNHQHQQQVKSQ